MNKYVTILNFSARNGGNCEHIGEFISKYYGQYTVKSYHIRSKQIGPCEGCNYECLTIGEECPMVNSIHREIMDGIIASDLAVFVVPNYCGYPSANYFAFNERSVGYFNMDREKLNAYMNVPKAFIVVSNTEGFEPAMRQQTNSDPKILYMKSGKYRKRSTAGDILDSEEAKNDLLYFLSQISI